MSKNPDVLTPARLKYLCEVSGISQRELSRASGIFQPNISLIFQGKRTPTAATMVKLSKGYHKLCAAAS